MCIFLSCSRIPDFSYTYQCQGYIRRYLCMCHWYFCRSRQCIGSFHPYSQRNNHMCNFPHRWCTMNFLDNHECPGHTRRYQNSVFRFCTNHSNSRRWKFVQCMFGFRGKTYHCIYLVSMNRRYRENLFRTRSYSFPRCLNTWHFGGNH